MLRLAGISICNVTPMLTVVKTNSQTCIMMQTHTHKQTLQPFHFTCSPWHRNTSEWIRQFFLTVYQSALRKLGHVEPEWLCQTGKATEPSFLTVHFHSECPPLIFSCSSHPFNFSSSLDPSTSPSLLIFFTPSPTVFNSTGWNKKKKNQFSYCNTISHLF